jgi:DNA-directed RNA polymerase subunit RPC12/RpoP
MSEFKFACPICGQHITADSKDTGSQIPCPTCFRKIVVPQAPASEDSKFVVSASEVNKPRPPQSGSPFEGFQRAPEKTISTALIVLLVLACTAGATLYALRGKIFHAKPVAEQAGDRIPETGSTNLPDYAGPSLWTLDLASAKIPDSTAAGALHQKAFTLDRATLTGSNLTLRVGRTGPVELGLNIYFFNRQPEELSGKSAEVKPTDSIAPRVVLRWKEEGRESKTFHGGYAMRIEFGAASNEVIPGKIFLCLPDESKSWIAGTFRAEIRKPGRPRPPRTPAPSQSQ